MSPLAFAVLLLAAGVRAESFQAWAARGARAESRKDDRAALEAYTSALDAWKDGDGALPRAKVLCARAAVRERSGDDAGAEEDYTSCLETEKKNKKAFDRRGRLRLKAGRTTAAIGDFYKAVALDIDYGEAYADRARAYELQGDRTFAREDYRHACQLGVKRACAEGRRASEPKKPPAEAPKPAPVDNGVVQINKEPPAKKAPPKRAAARLEGCRSAVQACADAGPSIGDCVDKAPICERKPGPGCCPQACVNAFRLSAGAGGHSEMDAFRSVFAPGSRCVAPTPGDGSAPADDAAPDAAPESSQ
jgi:tetratricopeptide (TPR) repeat protein